MAKKVYDGSDIETLESDRERMQNMSHLYIPDKKLAGCLHIIREILDNATDEVLNAGGDVDIYYDEQTRECKVVDTGRGMPQDKLQELCEVLHSSGKFTKGEESVYNVSGGMNGVGTKIALYLSDYFSLCSTRDGQSVTRYYEDGEFIKEKVVKTKKSEHGTTVIFKLSDKYLKETNKVTCKRIKKMIEEKTDCCEGLEVTFHGTNKDGKTKKEKYSGLSISDLMKKYMTPTSKVWEFDYSDKNTTCSIAFGYDAKETEGSNLMGWTNFIYNSDGGTHVDALVEAINRVFKKYMLKSYFSEKEKKNYQIRKEDIELGLCGVVVLKTSKDPLFYGQFKQKVTAEWAFNEIVEFMDKSLNKLSDSDMKTIAGIIKSNIKARLSSQRARKQVKKVGNGLSKDAIGNYAPAKMTCSTNYRELYFTEGLSAGRHAETARYDFQEIYRLRGKVDNIFDLSLSQLSKIDIIDDISRIIGIVPGGKGKLKHDRICCLSDADPDGLYIQAGVIVIFALAFPQVIEEGRLYMIQPPLFGFEENGKKMFKSNNRDYITYLQDKFSKKNELYFGKKKFKKNELIDFLMKNERYLEFLKNVADRNVCSMKFTELIMSHLREFGIKKSSIDKWNKLIHKEFSKQVSAEWTDKHITIQGIKDSRYEMIELDEDLMNSKKTKKLLDLMDENLRNISGYKIDGEVNKKNLTMYQVLKIFDSYKADKLKRFKGSISLGLICSDVYETV